MSKTLIKLDETWRAYLDSLGANAGFVEGLIYQYLEDPAQVDERWRRTFDAVAADRKSNGGQGTSSQPARVEPVTGVATRAMIASRRGTYQSLVVWAVAALPCDDQLSEPMHGNLPPMVPVDR